MASMLSTSVATTQNISHTPTASQIASSYDNQNPFHEHLQNVADNVSNSNDKTTKSPVPFLDRLVEDGDIDKSQIIQLLVLGQPKNITQYSEHIYKLLSILYEYEHITGDEYEKLNGKAINLFDGLPMYQNLNNPLASKLYLIVEKNFDMLIKISVDAHNLNLSTRAVRFLTEVISSLNYWEIYNLLTWKPAIYHFLCIIQFNMNECYLRFIKDYSSYNFRQQYVSFNRDNVGKRSRRITDGLDDEDEDEDEDEDMYDDNTSTNEDNENYSSGSNTPLDGKHMMIQHSGLNSQLLNADGEPVDMDGDTFINSDLKSLAPKDRKRITIEPKLARKIIKRANTRISTKSSNYDPDVVHECQLPSADEHGKMCLRRFSRKYELIRHQETVHSKKKKLFKCFVCVKQNPSIGPRIFTRHDTLAKHIRVNHKISGKEAKAEVAFSKKHAEVVEEGDITVHVGRRKTKVDFELRAHMEKKRINKDGEYYEADYSMDGDMDDSHDGNLIVVDQEDDMDDDVMDETETHEMLTPNRSDSPPKDYTPASSFANTSQPENSTASTLPPILQNPNTDTNPILNTNPNVNTNSHVTIIPDTNTNGVINTYTNVNINDNQKAITNLNSLAFDAVTTSSVPVPGVHNFPQEPYKVPQYYQRPHPELFAPPTKATPVQTQAYPPVSPSQDTPRGD